MSKCLICSRPLNEVDDPLSGDCGGDCRGCIILAENLNAEMVNLVERIIELEGKIGNG